MKPAAILALVAPVTYALPELAISKAAAHSSAALNSVRRGSSPHQPRTVGTNVFDVLRWSNGGAYYANITVGTPAQPQTVILDTGSSDLYFDASDAWACRNSSDNDSPCLGGTFDRAMSRTYREVSVNGTFNTSFGDLSTAVGPYGADHIGIGSVSIEDVQFGVAEGINSTTSDPIGLLGLGYSVNEARNSTNVTIYPNLVDSMVNSGVIESRLYSVDLGRKPDLSGSILFGGIDTSKYQDPLTTLNLLPTLFDDGTLDTGISQFITTITDAELIIKGETHTLWENGTAGVDAYSSSSPTLPVLLDTGSTAWSVPSSYRENIKRVLKAQDISACNSIDREASLNLVFGGKAQIQVPVSDLFAPLINMDTGAPEKLDDGADACLFLVADSSSPNGLYIAGDVILRSMYTVFDLDNGQVSIAQARTDISTPANIVEVKAGPDGVVNAVSGVITAPSNTWSLPPAATGTVAVSATTLATPIGTATGLDAIPSSGQVNGTIPSVGVSGQSTFVTSTTAPSYTGSSSIPTASPSQAGRVCPKDGALVCNGPNEFGLCNFGQVIWQPVAPGTACKNDGIVGVGIYAVPE